VFNEPKIPDLLDKSPLFRGIPSKILAPIFKQSIQINLEKGERLLSPGVINENVYILLSGQLGVHLTLSNLDEPLAILNPGECVGEMSVLVDSAVSAYVIAKTNCELLVIGHSAFWSLIKGSNESARNMLNILVQRIRMGNEVIADTLHGKLPEKKTLIDSMTGLYSQHALQEKFGHMLDLCIAAKQPLSLIVIKVDEVKYALNNDRELIDDQPLHVVSQTILTLLRPDDHAARLSGNTFAMILVNLPFSDVRTTVERLRATVCQLPIRLPNGNTLHPVTISAGFCKANEDDSWSTLLVKANQALGRALEFGPNHISD